MATFIYSINKRTMLQSFSTILASLPVGVNQKEFAITKPARGLKYF